MAPIVAFDNSGTLSETTVASGSLSAEHAWAHPVPSVPVDRGEVALLNVGYETLEPFRTDEPLGRVIEDHDVPVRIALSNCDLSVERACEPLFADDRTPAYAVPAYVERAVARAAAKGCTFPRTVADDPVAGAQVVVNVTDGVVVRIVGYTATPIESAPAVVSWARERGYEPHVVSGDSPSILGAVAETVGVPSENVHAYQSAVDKRRTVESLREDGPVVMVGDFVNDRFAFEAADRAVFVDHGRDRVRDRLAPLADVTIPSLSDVPDVLSADDPAVEDIVENPTDARVDGGGA